MVEKLESVQWTSVSLGTCINHEYGFFRHERYFVGAIYFTIRNLQWKNVILSGLTRATQWHLLRATSGWIVKIMGWYRTYCTRWVGVRNSMLWYIQASRKVCAFLSYNTYYGCSKCLKWFSGGFGGLDCSGFDHHNWTPRTQVLALDTQCNHTKWFRKADSGCRYSVLVKLPYFDAPQIDPMHNLFLGSTSLKMCGLIKALFKSVHLLSFKKELTLLKYLQV